MKAKKKTITIEKKMSGTGSIYDIASDLEDIEISMDGFEYAIVTPSYYNARPTRHRSLDAAVAKYRRMSDLHPTVLDANGVDVTDDIQQFIDNGCLIY